MTADPWKFLSGRSLDSKRRSVTNYKIEKESFIHVTMR